MLFRMSAVELGFFVPSQKEETLPLLAVSSKDLLSLFPIAASQGTSETTDVSEGGAHLLRRQLLQKGLAGATLSLFSPVTVHVPLWERFSRTLERSLQVDTHTLTGLQQITNSYWSLRTSIGYKHMLFALLGHFETIHQLLGSLQRNSAYQHLCAIASETAQCIGAVYFDMDDQTNALAYYKSSIVAAKEANNPLLWSTGLGRMSSVLISHGNCKGALPLLQEAEKFASAQNKPGLLAWLFSMEAEALSNVQEEQQCLHALKKAENALARRVEEHADDMRFDTARLVGYTGTCYLRLCQPKEAIATFDEINNPTRALSPRQTSIVLSDVAAAYAQQKEIEEACNYAVQALEINQRIQSSLVLKRLHAIYHAMEYWHALHCVKNFEEQMIVQTSTTI